MPRLPPRAPDAGQQGQQGPQEQQGQQQQQRSPHQRGAQTSSGGGGGSGGEEDDGGGSDGGHGREPLSYARRGAPEPAAAASSASDALRRKMQAATGSNRTLQAPVPAPREEYPPGLALQIVTRLSRRLQEREGAAQCAFAASGRATRGSAMDAVSETAVAALLQDLASSSAATEGEAEPSVELDALELTLLRCPLLPREMQRGLLETLESNEVSELQSKGGNDRDVFLRLAPALERLEEPRREALESLLGMLRRTEGTARVAAEDWAGRVMVLSKRGGETADSFRSRTNARKIAELLVRHYGATADSAPDPSPPKQARSAGAARAATTAATEEVEDGSPSGTGMTTKKRHGYRKLFATLKTKITGTGRAAAAAADSADGHVAAPAEAPAARGVDYAALEKLEARSVRDLMREFGRPPPPPPPPPSPPDEADIEDDATLEDSSEGDHDEPPPPPPLESEESEEEEQRKEAASGPCDDDGPRPLTAQQRPQSSRSLHERVTCASSRRSRSRSSGGQ